MKTATKTTEEPARETFNRLATSAEIEAARRSMRAGRKIHGTGSLGEVAALIAQWFPGDAIEVYATGREPHSGYLRFNLIVGHGAAAYGLACSFRDISEAVVGRALGHLDVALEARSRLDVQVARARGNGLDGQMHAYIDAKDLVPLRGWFPAS